MCVCVCVCVCGGPQGRGTQGEGGGAWPASVCVRVSGARGFPWCVCEVCVHVCHLWVHICACVAPQFVLVLVARRAKVCVHVRACNCFVALHKRMPAAQVV